MNSIFDYKEFKEDVVGILKDVMSASDLKIDETCFDATKHHKHTHLFLSNDFVVLELNTIIHFPYENSVGLVIYLKDYTTTITSPTPLQQLGFFIGVDKKEGKYKQIIQEYTSLLKNIQSNSNRVYYQESLKYIRELLCEVFFPLLSGMYNYDMFIEWKEFASKNTEFMQREGRPLSYQEYKNTL